LLTQDDAQLNQYDDCVAAKTPLATFLLQRMLPGAMLLPMGFPNNTATYQYVLLQVGRLQALKLKAIAPRGHRHMASLFLNRVELGASGKKTKKGSIHTQPKRPNTINLNQGHHQKSTKS
jgi:hypothetical protein